MFSGSLMAHFQSRGKLPILQFYKRKEKGKTSWKSACRIFCGESCSPSTRTDFFTHSLNQRSFCRKGKLVLLDFQLLLSYLFLSPRFVRFYSLYLSLDVLTFIFLCVLFVLFGHVTIYCLSLYLLWVVRQLSE